MLMKVVVILWSSTASLRAAAETLEEFYNNDALTSSLDNQFGPWDTPGETFLNRNQENFGAKWRIEEDEEALTLLLAANTQGWLGFGIGEPSSGSMLGADIVVASVNDDGEVLVSDRYVPWASYPLDQGASPFPMVDEHQDWIALAGYQTENGTAVVLQRKLDTQDNQDRPIHPTASTPIIFAYGETMAFGYHGGRRGVGDLQFKTPPGGGGLFVLPPDVDGYVDVKMPSVLLPEGVSDAYGHYSIDLGEIDDIVAFDFDAASTSPHFMHHFTLYVCSDPDSVYWRESYPEAKMYTVQPPLTSCHNTFGWALGGNPQVMPPNVAFRGMRYILLQGHYNMPLNGTDSEGNPTYLGAGTFDNSGLRLYTTSKRRKYKAESLVVYYEEKGAIPAGHKEVHYESVCVSTCTEPLTHPLKVFSTFLHMHSFGKQIWTSQYDADGNPKGVIAQTDYWNFQFQKTVEVDAVVVEPGDQLRLHCVFDTSKSATDLTWGEMSAQEMCLSILYYYVEDDAEQEVGKNLEEPDYQLLQCGGIHMPWIANEKGVSFCNNAALIRGTKLASNAEPLPCEAATNTFPLPVTFGSQSIQVEGSGEGDKECSSGLGAWQTAAIVCASMLLLVMLVVGYTDFWTVLLYSDTTKNMKTEPSAPSGSELSETTGTSGPHDGAAAESLPRPAFSNDFLIESAIQFAKDNPFDDRLLLDRFREHVMKDPDRLLYAWLDDKANVLKQFTRKELWDQSGSLAYHLKESLGLKAGDRALIVYPPGIDFLVGFVALLRLGVVVVSVYPPNPENLGTELPKFAHFVQDCGAEVALTTSTFHRVMKGSSVLGHKWPSLKWVVTDKKRQPVPTSWKDHVPESSDVALLQYTSGSTSQPKGVMITHMNIAMQCSYLERCHHVYGGTTLKQSQDVVSVSWTPAYHDMGLLGGYLSYMPSGGTAYGMSPITFMRDPTIWVKAMRRYKATCTNGPNFAFALTCKRLQALKDKNKLRDMPRIPSLKFVVLGAEPSDIRLLNGIEFLMGIDRSAVASMYGLAEHVLAVSSGASQKLYPNDSLWSVGNLRFSKAVGDVTAKIVDPDTFQELPVGEQGEIWLASRCVAAGYWGNAEATEATFKGRLAGQPNETFLRTGDIGMIRDDELFVVSRLKDLIIVNGKNIAPTDVEHAVEEQFPAIVRPGSSVAFQTTPQSAVLICELRPEAQHDTSLELAVQQMKVHVERSVEGLELDDIIVVAKGTVLKTSSGKVKRKAMKKLWEDNDFARVVDSSGSLRNGELRRAKSFEELFRLVGVEDFELTLVENGVDSMKLVQLVEVARENFGAQIEYAQASSLSVADLMAHAVTTKSDQILQVPLAQEFSEKAAQDLLPGTFMRMARQTLILVVVTFAILCSIVPSASYLRHNWLYDSDWWVHRYRAGPLVALAFPIWMLSYTAICVIFKWLILGRQKPGEFLSFWSGRFSRYWTVVRLVQVWEATVGLVVADTPLKNIFYQLLGSRISLTARIHSQIRCWDLVEIGARTSVKGNIFPRRMHFTGVYLDAVTIGSDCSIGSGAVIMDGVALKDRVRVANRTVVPPRSVLEATNGTWSGVPCSFNPDSKDSDGFCPTPLCSPFWTLARASFPPFFIVGIVCASWIANSLVYLPPEPSFSGPLEDRIKAAHTYLWPMAIYFHHWDTRAYALSISYLLVHQLAGLLMLFTCAFLKWSFVCPYLVDRAEPLILRFYFPYLLKTIFHQWWHQLFGLRVHVGAHVVANRMVVSASTAHRVRLGRDSILFSMTCSPQAAPDDTAASVWDWVASGYSLKSPWASIFAQPDISIGDNCECAAGSFLEHGVSLEEGSGTSTMSRVPANATIQPRKRAVGNPADLMLPSKDSSDLCEKPTLSKFAAELLRGLLLALHLAWLFVTAVVIMELLRDLSLPNHWEMEITVPLLVVLAVALATISLVVEIVLTKKVLFGRTQIASTHLQSFKGVVFHHLQVIGQPIEFLIWPMFGGLYPLALYFKALGARLDATSVFINSNGYIDPGDADNTTVRPFAVMDEGSHCVCHRVDHGRLNQGEVMLNSGSVLHPGSGLMLGSLGKGSQLFPLSKALREMHTGDEQVWIGLPAVLACCAGEEERRHPVAKAGGGVAADVEPYEFDV